MKRNFKILVDEMCAGLIPYLKALGWKISPSAKNGEKDCELVKIAKKRKAIIVTRDRGSAVRCQVAGVPYATYDFNNIRDSLMIDRKLTEIKNILEFYNEEKKETKQ